jgi:tRNA (guanine-N7-)-methyltransferase
MPRSKLIRFKEIQNFPNVIDLGSVVSDQDRNLVFLKDTLAKSVILELGCGTGEYALEMAKTYPQKFFIGVDIKGERIWKGADKAIKENLSNLKFIRTHILNLDKIFLPQQIEEIWITFPDPQPKDDRRKLTSARFLEIYSKICRSNAKINLKSDNLELVEYTQEVCKNLGLRVVNRLNITDLNDCSPELQIQTKFELKFRKMAKEIYFLQFLI